MQKVCHGFIFMVRKILYLKFSLLFILFLPGCYFSTPILSCKVKRIQPQFIIKKNSNYVNENNEEVTETVIYVSVHGTCQ